VRMLGQSCCNAAHLLAEFDQALRVELRAVDGHLVPQFVRFSEQRQQTNISDQCQPISVSIAEISLTRASVARLARVPRDRMGDGQSDNAAERAGTAQALALRSQDCFEALVVRSEPPCRAALRK